MPSNRRDRRKKNSRRLQAWFSLFALAGTLVLFGAGAIAVYAVSLDRVLVEKFSGRRWDFPSKIYSDSTLLYPGVNLRALGLERRLERLGYREVGERVSRPGQYRRSAERLEIYLRPFPYAAGPSPARAVSVHTKGGRVVRIEDAVTGAELPSLELEPELVAGLYQDVWEQRRFLPLEKIPALLVHAVLAVEDQRFFEHHGIDPLGIARAFWTNLASGRIVQGGSTLTQQLVKNFFFGSERSFRRKFREAIMALLAERRYSKRKILETYLNEIYWGQNGPQGIFGVWEASRFYFRKEPSELSLPEAALLAGLIRAPNAYSPFRNPERARARRNHVLRLMHRRGILTKAQLREAEAAPLGVVPPPEERPDAPYFVDFLRRELLRNYPEETLVRDGLWILSTLDVEMQKAAERAVREGLEELERRYPRLAKSGAPLEACLVALRPQTGEIKAMMGGRDYRQTQFNRVTQARRQPGSVFKPFVYLAALDHAPGRSAVRPTTLLLDEPFTWEYDGRRWSPENYRSVFFGPVTVRTALERSLNAATARLARETGLERIRSVARRMGIESPLPLYPAMVLGAVDVTPLEVATAYAALANQGLRATPFAVRAVLDPSGKLVERRPVEIHQAVRPEVAYLVTHILEGVLDRGTGADVRRLGFLEPAAGKTGTTNDYRDAWFAGFTPDLVAVVWVGFDDNRPVGLTGAQAALPIWVRFMKEATAAYPSRPFQPPPGVRLVRIDPESGKLATERCPRSIEEAFLEGEEPVEPCPLHRDVLF